MLLFTRLQVDTSLWAGVRLHGGDRRRAGSVHAVAGPGRAERGHRPGPGRRHLLGDVLPVAGRLVRGGDPRRGARRPGSPASSPTGCRARSPSSRRSSGRRWRRAAGPASRSTTRRRSWPCPGPVRAAIQGAFVDALHMVFLTTGADRRGGGAGHPGPAEPQLRGAGPQGPPTTPRPRVRPAGGKARAPAASRWQGVEGGGRRRHGGQVADDAAAGGAGLTSGSAGWSARRRPGRPGSRSPTARERVREVRPAEEPGVGGLVGDRASVAVPVVDPERGREDLVRVAVHVGVVRSGPV